MGMVDIGLGTVDERFLRTPFMIPERMVMCHDRGIPWARAFARNGADGIPEHPGRLINNVIGRNVPDDLRALFGLEP